jgi:peptide/nickel transport system substrate-binding protein
VTIDPVDSWDGASNNVILQVCETLFWYDLRKPDLPLEPLLVDEFSWDGTNTILTMTLKEEIWFHDNTKFNASAVKWNVDRWLYLTNSTKELSDTTVVPAFPSTLYYHPDGTPIINSSVVNSEYNVSIILNKPFGPFLPLLGYASNSIISPASVGQDEYIDLTTGDLVGTGPFVYDYYRTDIEVRMSRWGRYWRTGAFFEKVVFSIIEDDSTRNLAMLDQNVDFLIGVEDTLIAEFDANPDIAMNQFGTDLLYWYIAFNNNLINVTFREALSYAYNYSYIIEEIQLGQAERGCPAVPQGMPGHNASVQANLPTFNIPYARSVMQSMGFGTGWDASYPGTHEANWLAATFATDILGHPLKLNLHSGSNTNRRLNDLAFANWALIGVDTQEETLDWTVFLDYGESDPDHLEVWYVGWGPDYLDAFNMLDPLFNPASASNFGQIDIAEVTAALTAAIAEPDFATRNEYYEKCQYLLYEKNFVHMPLWATYQQFVHEIELEDYPYNTLGNLYVWPAYR